MDPEADSSSQDYQEFLKNKSKDELINILLMQKEEKIPLSIFKNDLGPLEALVKYLKEHKSFTIKKISIKLNRSNKTIWTTYHNVEHKNLVIRSSEYSIPLSVFSKKQMSILESLVYYLRHFTELNYHQIAILLARDDRTIWTVYKRAERKSHDR